MSERGALDRRIRQRYPIENERTISVAAAAAAVDGGGGERGTTFLSFLFDELLKAFAAASSYFSLPFG